MIKSITIRVLPHANHRSDTIGDYFETSTGDWVIHVSQTKNWRHAALVIAHELVELVTTQAAGISELVIARFDKRSRADEPGDSPRAPYHRQHVLATNIERIIANEFRIDWKTYNQALADLWKPKKRSKKKHRQPATSALKK